MTVIPIVVWVIGTIWKRELGNWRLEEELKPSITPKIGLDTEKSPGDPRSSIIISKPCLILIIIK